MHQIPSNQTREDRTDAGIQIRPTQIHDFPFSEPIIALLEIKRLSRMKMFRHTLIFIWQIFNQYT